MARRARAGAAPPAPVPRKGAGGRATAARAVDGASARKERSDGAGAIPTSAREERSDGAGAIPRVAIVRFLRSE